MPGGKIEVRSGASASGSGFGVKKEEPVTRQVKMAVFDDGVFTRVPARADNLASNKVCVLDADGEVFSWSGARSGRVDRAIAEAPDGVIISIPSNTVVDTALTKLANAGAPPPCPPAAHLPAGTALTPPRRAQV